MAIVSPRIFPGVGNKGVWKTQVPSGVQGLSPGGGLGTKPSEANDIFLQ